MTARAKRTLVAGTRASRLALWQTNFVIDTLAASFPGLECRVETFKTVGDDIVDRPLPELGGKGVFTARLERALLAGDVDIAVHSLKDLPVEVTPGLALGAVTRRADARDVLISRTGVDLEMLPRGAVVGTSSLRRRAQLLRVRPDLRARMIRGNVETRIRKVMEGEYDATVLAAAGLDRLDLDASVSERLPFDVMLPAPGQGALAVQCRADDEEVLELLRALDDPRDRRAVLAERAFLENLGGGCAAPVAALARTEPDGAIVMTGLVARPDGRSSVRVQGSDPDGPALAARLATEALARGARPMLDDAREALASKLPLHGKRIVVTRAADQGDDFCNALSALGATPVRLPMIRTVPVADRGTIDTLLREAASGDWIVFTSVNGVSAVWDLVGDPARFGDLRVAAVGPATARALEERSVTPDFVPDEFTGEAVAGGMPDIRGRGVWLLRAETAGETIVDVLSQRGAVVHDVPVYRTEAVPIDPAGAEELTKTVDAITFTSGSTAHNFKAACEQTGIRLRGKPLVACIGPATADTARDLGFDVRLVAEEHTTSGLVDALATYFSEVS